MTTTPIDRAAINRRNAQKSTGPRTPEGKNRSKFNAVKHGMTARTLVLPDEDANVLQMRLETWIADLKPQNDVEQALVEHAVHASWKLERADRAEVARLSRIIESVPAAEANRQHEEAAALGRRLFSDRDLAGDANLQGEILNALLPGRKSQPVARPLDVLDHPEAIVLRLEFTAAGCQWMIDRWTELHDILDQGHVWPTVEKVKAIRLLGKQPLDMGPEQWENHRERRFLNPDPDLDAHYDRMFDRQLDDRLGENDSATIAGVRSVADRTIARLESLAEGHRLRAEADAAQQAALLSFDASTEGERLRRYQFSCSRSLFRSLDTLLEVRRSGLGAASGERAEESSEYHVPCSENPVVDQGNPQDEPTVPPVDQGNPKNEPTTPPVDQGPPQDEPMMPQVAAVTRPKLPFHRDPVFAISLIVLFGAAVQVHHDSRNEPKAPPVDPGNRRNEATAAPRRAAGHDVAPVGESPATPRQPGWRLSGHVTFPRDRLPGRRQAKSSNSARWEPDRRGCRRYRLPVIPVSSYPGVEPDRGSPDSGSVSLLGNESTPLPTSGILDQTMTRSLSLNTVVGLVVWLASSGVSADTVKGEPVDAGTLPTDARGRALNLDFETGTLADWRAEGDAFRGQPIEGDAVHRRRGDMSSRHAGLFWVGSYERGGDPPKGTLTSVPFRLTKPFASFLIGGGSHDRTCVELVRKDSGKVVFRASGDNTEEMKRVVADLTDYLGREIVIRLVDGESVGWGHVNFDDFRLHATRPVVPPRRRPAALDVYQHAGLGPDAAARAMTVPPGFKVTLFAGEPDVVQPIAMAIDDRGRVWVAEAYSYPRRVPDAQARDRILIFEDTDGDGRFNTRKVFADRLNLVSGLALGFGGVWVGAAPQLLFIPDRDGDDRPDGPPQVLLDGWGQHDTHETLNTFTWGPDGWLYGCHGVFTHSRVGKPGTPQAQRTPINAGIWRYHPTRHAFEVFAQGTSNPWGIDFDARGQLIITACVIPHLYHIAQGGRYERQAGQHFSPYTYDDIKTIADHRHYLGFNPHGGNGRSDSAGGGHAALRGDDLPR